MNHNLEWLSRNINYIVIIVSAICAFCGFVWKVVGKPVKENFGTINKKLQNLSKDVNNLNKDTGDILCSQLVREHDYMVKQGFCSTHDKERIGEIYKGYKDRGRNHIADTFMDDILALPTEKKTTTRRTPKS